MPPAMQTPAVACAMALLVATLHAHGGQYRGPGNVTPPSASGAGSTAGAAPSGSPSSPTPTGAGAAGRASTPPGSAPRSVSARPTAGNAPRGYAVGDDLGRWEFWWEFGKDPFLDLRTSLFRSRRADAGQKLWNPRLGARGRDILPPNAADCRDVAEQLRALLAAARDRDTVSACAIALAKIGPERAGFPLLPELLPLLQRGDQELRETAAVALGISGALDARTVQVLRDLVADAPAARRLGDRGPVNTRTRAFAAFGAGLLLRRCRTPATSMRLVRTLLDVVDHADEHDRNMVVAAIEALALFPNDWRGAAADALRGQIIDRLGAFYDRDLGAGAQLLQAHVPTAIAGLVPPGDASVDAWRDRFAAELRGGLRATGGAQRSKVNPHVAQSCALALGVLCRPWDDEQSDSHIAGELLTRVYHDHRDQQTRAFATLSLGRIGGERGRAFLLGELTTANKALEQPWIAVALGVIGADLRARGEHEGAGADAYEQLTTALLGQLDNVRNPSTVGALAVGLGLTGTSEARDPLRRHLVTHRKRDAVAGYVALSLGLLQDARAVPDLRSLREASARRPFVLLQSVRALGLLGDRALNDQLVAELQASGQSVARLAATATALGQIGDRRCLPALQELASDDDATPLSRAFAAVALGSVCDKDPLPWNAAYASYINYRASTETLTDGGAGILDLL